MAEEMLLNPSGSRRLVGLCGRLRSASLIRYALRLATSSLPLRHEIQVLEWREVLPFDADLLQYG